MTYREELIQVAAVALAMAQMDEIGTTSRDDPDEVQAEKDLLQEIQIERQAQELQWGTRRKDSYSRSEFYTVLGEEFGEVGRAILEGE